MKRPSEDRPSYTYELANLVAFALLVALVIVIGAIIH